MTNTVKTVLLVDDDAITNYLHNRVLTKTDLASSEIIIANDGQHGIETLLGLNETLKNKNDKVVVFLDINMPVMDGWGFLKTLEENKEKINFTIHLYVLSSSINSDDQERAESNSLVTKYLKKPLSIEVIESLLQSIE
jgi:CheY-like chemotaxis protein